MMPDLAFWVQLLGVLTLELALTVGAVALFARWTRTSQLRRSLWQAGLAALALMIVVESVGLRRTLGRMMPAAYPPPERRLVAAVRPILDSESASPFPELDRPAPDPVAPVSPFPPAQSAVWWPGSLWLLGALLLGLRGLALRGWLARERRCAEPGDTATRTTIARLQGPLGLRRVELRVWPRLRGPVAFGTLWPTIAVPADFAARFTLAQREAMLAHELAHLAGRDPWWLALADVVCALAWWHPGVWWARRQFRAASEAAADEASTLVPEGVTALAESLVIFGRELATSGPARSLGVAGSGFHSELGRRVTALLATKSAWRPLDAGQRWRVRLTALGGVVALASLPWPSTGLPDLMVQKTSAQDPNPEVSPTRDEVSARDQNREVNVNSRNRVGLTGVSTAPVIGPTVSLVGLPKETWGVIHDPVLVGSELQADQKSMSFPTSPWSNVFSGGWWSSPPPGSERMRYVKLREESVSAASPESSGNPLVGGSAVSRSESTSPTATNDLYTRTYRLRDPGQFLAAIRQTGGVTPSTNIQADLKQFLALCGLDFPPLATSGTPHQSTRAIFLNDRTGILFVRAQLGILDRVGRIVATLSADPSNDTELAGPEITLLVQLAEVPVGSATDLGFDWLFGLSPTNNPLTETTQPNPKTGTRVDTLTSKGEWVTLKAPQFDALRRSLETRAGVDLLTAPAVTTRSGRSAQVVVQDVRTIVTGVYAAVDPQTKAVGFDDVSVSATNTQPGINYQTETISTGPAVDILPHAENDGWRLTTVARVTEFVGYEDPGKGHEPFVQAPGAKPLKATKPLPRLRIREMRATAFAKPGETVVLRGAMVTQTNLTRSANWLVRRTYTNVVTQRLYAFITPQFAQANTGGSVSTLQPLIVHLVTNETHLRVGDQMVKDIDLPAALEATRAAKPDLILLIRADVDAPRARLQAMTDAAAYAGIPIVLLEP